MTKNADVNILDIFECQKLVKICAPMVRYSKLQFRNLVKKYGTDMSFTPMILADSFCKSELARNNEFTTNKFDLPLVTQFAANTVHDFVGAAYMVSPYCNGVDLNCGCPQRWAKQLGLGCSMLNKPELIFDIVRQCRNQISKPFTVSVKTRISKNIQKTVEVCKKLEMAGVSFLTIHARTSDQLTGDINTEQLRLICENVRIPVIANGGIKSLSDCYDLQENVKCKGVMVANGILTNPTIFNGTEITSMECVQQWVNICYNSTLTPESYEKLLSTGDSLLEFKEKPINLTFQCFHHHLVFMLEKILTKQQKRIFNNLKKFKDVLDFLQTNFNISPKLFGKNNFNLHKRLPTDYEGRDALYNRLKPETEIENDAFLYNYETDGKYFSSKLQKVEQQENNCDWTNIFIEND
ncbi:tRNA-dihydrouridine(20a/20b) synthase [NAD(P)+]-like [Aethina tumida]|uniref:tRNA-dihydrouridine(20a/20b) synthase [NAD(P)+]-like n=1 Tax=Aethina tumida TaxID=116153 RepID=UPI00096B1814|nr:tRNA-dihydrouridine(20a/20b) synthase [NAD(P)+]-like [Aethina tumida]